MRKALLLLIVVLGLGFQASAQQFEIKTNPLFLLIPEATALPVSAELVVNESWGAEVDLLISSFAVGYLSAKHYFNPKQGADRFYIGAFVGGIAFDGDATAGFGFFLGQKWLSQRNVVFDLGIGIGRGFGEIPVLPYAKAHVGYRFGANKSKK